MVSFPGQWVQCRHSLTYCLCTDTIFFRLGLFSILSWHHCCRRPPLLLLPTISHSRLRPKIKTCRRRTRSPAAGKRPFCLGDALVEDQGEGSHPTRGSGRRHIHAIRQHVSQHVCHHGGGRLRHLDPNQLHEFHSHIGWSLLDHETDPRRCHKQCTMGHRSLCLDF